MSLIKEIRIISGQTILIKTSRRQYRIRAEDWFSKKFKKGQELVKQDRNFLLEKSISFVINDYALRQLSISQKSKFELRNKIKNKTQAWLKNNKNKYDGKSLDQLIDNELLRLEKNKLIDDKQYVSSFINKSKNKSNRQIEYELKCKGVSEDGLKQVLKDRQNNEEEAIRNIINKRKKHQGKLNFKERSRLMVSLVRKGFPIDKVKNIIDE